MTAEPTCVHCGSSRSSTYGAGGRRYECGRPVHPTATGEVGSAFKYAACEKLADLRAERDELLRDYRENVQAYAEMVAERDKERQINDYLVKRIVKRTNALEAERDRYRAALTELVDAVRWHNVDSYNRELPDWRDYAEFVPNVSPLDGHTYKTALNGDDDE